MVKEVSPAYLQGEGELIDAALKVCVGKKLVGKLGLTAMSNMSAEDIASLGECTKAQATQLVAIFELGRRAGIKVEGACTSAVQTLGWFQDMTLLRTEAFRVLCLDSRRRVIKAETISVGTISQCLVHPREVFYPAIKEGAVAIIVGHNHPSGDPTPSADDFAMTDRLVQAGSLIGIELLDHLIVSKTGYRSLRALGRIGVGQFGSCDL